MPNTEDITLQQGDTKRWVVPVLNGNDPGEKFETGLPSADIEFAISEGTGGPVVVNGQAVSTQVETLDNVEPGVDSYEDLDSIPTTQDVLVVTVPATETAALLPDGPDLRYQIRLLNPATGEKVTPIKGSVDVEGSPLE
jgi:hypothetical protein